MALPVSSQYDDFLAKIKSQIFAAQQKAFQAVNTQLIVLYWSIGREILAIQEQAQWGSKVVDDLALDLRMEFPGEKGFSKRNLQYMRKFASEYPDLEFVQSTIAQISWTHNIVLLDKVDSMEERAWYSAQTAQNHWSVSLLKQHIESGTYARQVLAEKTTNFSTVLPAPQSELAQAMIKDPYILDFVELTADMKEADLERELTNKISRTLLELGAGFAFMGSQYHLPVGGEDYYLDMLFYNTRLRCYFVVELKTDAFKPEYAGKLNFYLSAVDDILKTEADNPSIGILFCQDKNRVVAEYALRDMTKPMGVSKYELVSRLPEKLKKELPEIEKLEKI